MTWWLSRSYSQILRACWVKSSSAHLPGVWGKVHSTQSSGLFMQHAFPSLSAARKVSNAFFYPDTCPWFIELSHSAIQLRGQPAVAFLSLKTISLLSQTEKESRQRRTISRIGSQSFPVARRDVHNNYFSSNLGIACGPRQYPRQFSNLDIVMRGYIFVYFRKGHNTQTIWVQREIPITKIRWHFVNAKFVHANVLIWWNS